ncbi:MAG: DoxX family protein [Pseudomonadota bacterium]
MKNPVDIAALLLRLALGSMFLAHGLLKVLVFTLPGTVGFFESVGFPGFLAYVVTVGEILGGVLLIAGVGTRAVSIALIPVLLGATYVHSGAGWLFSNENGGWEYPAFLVVTAIVQALLGSGRYALRLPQPKAAAEPAVSS